MVYVPPTPVRHLGGIHVGRLQDRVVIGHGDHEHRRSAFSPVVPGWSRDRHARQQIVDTAAFGVDVAIPQATIVQREHARDDLKCAPLSAPRRGVPPDDLDHVSHDKLAPVGDPHLPGPPACFVDGSSGRVNPHVRAAGMAGQPLGQIATSSAPQIKHVRRPCGVRVQDPQRPADQKPLDGVVTPPPVHAHPIQVTPSAGLGDPPVAVRAVVGHGVWGGKLRVTCADSLLAWHTPVCIVRAIAWVAPNFNRLAGVSPCNTAVACVLGVRLCLGFGHGGTTRIQATWGLRPAVFVLLWIAHKTVEDVPVSNADMDALWQQMTPDTTPCLANGPSSMVHLERSILSALGWRAHVPDQLYSAMARALQALTPAPV